MSQRARGRWSASSSEGSMLREGIAAPSWAAAWKLVRRYDGSLHAVVNPSIGLPLSLRTRLSYFTISSCPKRREGTSGMAIPQRNRGPLGRSFGAQRRNGPTAGRGRVSSRPSVQRGRQYQNTPSPKGRPHPPNEEQVKPRRRQRCRVSVAPATWVRFWRSSSSPGPSGSSARSPSNRPAWSYSWRHRCRRP